MRGRPGDLNGAKISLRLKVIRRLTPLTGGFWAFSQNPSCGVINVVTEKYFDNPGPVLPGFEMGGTEARGHREEMVPPGPNRGKPRPTGRSGGHQTSGLLTTGARHAPLEALIVKRRQRLHTSIMGTSAVRRRDERLSFVEVIDRHQKAVYGYLLSFTRNVHDAQDLFQDTFLRAYRAYAALPRDADLRAWLMRIAVNLSKNHVRARQRRHRVLVDRDQLESSKDIRHANAATDAESTMISRETARILVASIESLPFRQRTALVQRQFGGLDYPAIAANLGCSQESARAHVYQALRKLRLSLERADSAIK
jgi:RNA polymerase sigma-70 factor, ECF subfamily